MKGEKFFNEIVLEEMAALENFDQKFGGKVFALQEKSERGFVERWIIEDGKELGWRNLMNETHEIIARGGLQDRCAIDSHDAIPCLLSADRKAIQAAISAGSMDSRLTTALGTLRSSA